MKVEHWSLRSRPMGRIEPPEMPGVCLHGQVIGHPYHIDGKEVLTTAVLNFGLDTVITKSGSEYELGEVDPAYEKLFPGAEQRLLRALDRAQPKPPELPPQGSSPRSGRTDHFSNRHAALC